MSSGLAIGMPNSVRTGTPVISEIFTAFSGRGRPFLLSHQETIDLLKPASSKRLRCPLVNNLFAIFVSIIIL